MSTTETTLLTVDATRWARECAAAGHPRWEADGCWCGEPSDPSSRPASSTVRDARPGTHRLGGRGGQLVVAALTVAALVLPVSPVGEDQAAPVVSSPRRAPELPDVMVDRDVPPGAQVGQVVPAAAGMVTPVEELSGSPAGVTALEAVRWCESRDDYRAENPVSSASGAFQFVDSTWEWVTGLPSPASGYPADVQDAAFLELWDDGAGATHWAPSRACWAPLIEGTQDLPNEGN